MKRTRLFSPTNTRLVRTKRRRSSTRERGVASILAMMFLILFGSLAAAMAIASNTCSQNSITSTSPNAVSSSAGCSFLSRP